MKQLPGIILALLLFCGMALGAGEEPISPHLQFLSASGSLAQKIGDTLHFNAGAVDTICTPHWKHTFIVQNPTHRVLTIGSLRGSCGCETLLLTKDGVQARQVRLAPGEQAEVLLDVHLTPDQFGFVRKYVWVYGVKPGQEVPLATLALDMTLRQSVVFTPKRLDFGSIPSGMGKEQKVTVTVDAALVSGLFLPPLVSSDPAIRGVPCGPLQKKIVNEKAVFCQQYAVVISPSASAGNVATELRFQTASGPENAPLMRPALPVAGIVAGNLSAMPASVFFGSLPAGRPATRTVVVSLAVAQSVGSLHVTCSASWLHAAFDPSDTVGKHHLLTVALTNQAPLGLLQGKITITAGKDESVMIPVVAEMTKSSG